MSSVARLGRLLLQPVISTGSWYNCVAKKHPFSCGVITSGVKTSAADIFAQKILEGKEELDWNRHAVFCTFGFTYLGAFQYWLYNIKFTQMCGPLTARFGHYATAPIKTALDQLVHHPFLYFPVFFSMKTTIQGKPLSVAVQKYRDEIWDSCKALWSVWVPAQLINFSLVPRHLRIPFVAATSFLWCVILSVMQGKFDSNQLDSALSAAEQQVQDGAAMALPVAPPAHRGAAGPTFASSPIEARR